MSAIGLIVVIIVVVSIILAIRSKRTFHSGSGTEGMSITRRVWLYLITLISLGIFAAGVGQLLTLLFDVTIKGSYLTQVGGTSFNQQQLSLGLAMLVIGGPLWFFFWRAVQRRVKGNQEEIGAGIRKLFLNFILVETSIMGITATSDFLRWLMAGVPLAEFSPSGLAIVIVAGIIWFYHWRVSESEGHPSAAAKTLRRWYVYVLAGFGLVWLAVGLVQLINLAVVNLPVWGNTLVRGQFWDNTAQMSIAMILLGGITWYFHWFRMAKGDSDSTLRQVYFYLLTISGGAITALVASTILLFRFFLWVFGGTPISVSPHFQFLGWAVPTIIAGLAIWGYHRRLAQEEAGRVQEKRLSTQRVYFYLMSFLGLGTLVAGLSMLFGILVDLIIYAAGTSLTVTAGWWQNQLALCLALLLVGTPIWLYYWNGILKRVQEGGIEEWRALSRRIFLYVIIGVSIITLAADLVNIIYQLLSGILQGNFGVNVLRSSKWSLQTLIVAVPLFWYHWQILRADQRHGAESAVIRHNVTLLADDRTGELASRLENKLGYKIRVFYQVGQTTETLSVLPDEEIDRLANEIRSSPSNTVMLVVFGGKVITLPYQDK
jgi:ABC-type multidrug transport system fused ATPase/permease subunit